MNKSKYWLYGIISLAIVGIIFISGCTQQGCTQQKTQYICKDGTTVVTDLNDCPKKAKLIVDVSCRAVCSHGIGGCTFPDIINGEIKLNAQEMTVIGVELEYELYSKSDSSVKYHKSKNVGNVDVNSEKTITFDYTRGDLSEVYDGGVGFPAGMVGMPFRLKITCDDCEITSSTGEKIVEDEATLTQFCSY